MAETETYADTVSGELRADVLQWSFAGLYPTIRTSFEPRGPFASRCGQTVFPVRLRGEDIGYLWTSHVVCHCA